MWKTTIQGPTPGVPNLYAQRKDQFFQILRNEIIMENYLEHWCYKSPLIEQTSSLKSTAANKSV